MSGKYQLSPQAIGDVREIWQYIAVENHNPSAADRLWLAIESACQLLAEQPLLGHRRKDLADDPELLFYCVSGSYLIIYRKGSEPLQIVRVLHGARDVAGELAPSGD